MTTTTEFESMEFGLTLELGYQNKIQVNEIMTPESDEVSTSVIRIWKRLRSWGCNFWTNKTGNFRQLRSQIESRVKVQE